MKQELDELLCSRYPKIFADRHKDMTQTAMCWGFDCGDGWFDVIDELCNKIQKHIDWNNTYKEYIPQVVVSQVKEKFGTLRFYYSGGDEYISGLVDMAAWVSSITCEQCGERGELRGVEWFYTACEKHIMDRDKYE
jgi:hypothetical protein